MAERKRLAALALVCAVIAAGGFSVTLGAQAPAFDAASIKENGSGSGDGVFRQQPGRFTVTNLSLRWVIQFAHGVREYQLVNVPSWTTRRYDITATFAPADASQDDLRIMLRRLLADRFGLRVHHEQRSLRVYELTRANPNALGSTLTPSPQVDCATASLAAPQCRRFMTGFFIKGVWSIPQLARSLEQLLSLPVVDRSSMNDVFAIDLQWGTGNIGDPVSTLGVHEEPALLTALREQLGLTLQAKAEPHDVVLIDAVSPPTPD